MKKYLSITDTGKYLVTSLEGKTKKQTTYESIDDFALTFQSAFADKPMVADLSFMSRDSIHVNMLSENSALRKLQGTDDVYILDDSILFDKKSMKVLKELADEYAANKEKMVSNFENAKKYIEMSQKDEKTYIEALRAFSRTHSLDDIRKFCPVEELIRCLKVQEKHWTNLRLFDSPILKIRYLFSIAVIMACIPTIIISLFSTLITGSFGAYVVLMSSLFAPYLASKIVLDDQENEKVISALRDLVGPEYYDMLDYTNDLVPEISTISKEKKEDRVVTDFADFVKMDIEFIRRHANRDFTIEIKKLNDLSANYFRSLKRSDHEDKEYLNALLDIEESLYATVEIGKKFTLDAPFDVETVRKRLIFAGFTDEELESPDLREIFEIIETLQANPFHGVETKVVSLIKEACNRLSEKPASDEVIKDAMQGLNIATQYDILMDSLAELENYQSDIVGRVLPTQDKNDKQQTAI